MFLTQRAQAFVGMSTGEHDRIKYFQWLGNAVQHKKSQRKQHNNKAGGMCTCACVCMCMYLCAHVYVFLPVRELARLQPMLEVRANFEDTTSFGQHGLRMTIYFHMGTNMRCGCVQDVHTKIKHALNHVTSCVHSFRTGETSFPFEVASHIFTRLLCDKDKMDYVNLCAEGYSCFESYFVHINNHHRCLLRPSTQNVTVTDYSSLVGMDALWSLAVYNRHASVHTPAKKFLTTLHLRLVRRRILDTN